MEFFQKKFVLIFLLSALFIGALHILPTLYARIRLGSSYKGIYPFESADEEHYDVYIKKAMEGYYHNKNNYLFEGRSDIKGGTFPFKSENILGYIGGSLGLSIGTWILVMRFIFPVLAFFLMFSLFRALNLSRFSALFWSFLNLLAPYLVYGWVDVFSRPFFTVLRDHGINYLWYEQYDLSTLPWARTVNPQFSGLFFLCAMILLVQIIKGNRPWIWLLPVLLLFYVNFRFYFYFWSAIGAFLLLAFILSLVFQNKKPLLPLGVILALILVSGFSHGLQLLEYSDSWTQHSHLPISSPGIIMALILLLLGKILSKQFALSSPEKVILFTMPLVCLVTMNQNIFTGRIVQPWHYELFTTPLLLSMGFALLTYRGKILPRICEYLRERVKEGLYIRSLFSFGTLLFFFTCGIILFFYFFKISPNYGDSLVYILASYLGIFFLVFYAQVFLYMLRTPSFTRDQLVFWGGGILLLLIGIEGINRQVFFSIKVKRSAQMNQYLAEPFRWLNQNTPPHSTVLASFEVSEKIPLYTHNTIYLCKNAFHEYTKSQEERWERTLNYFILTGYDESGFHKRLDEWPYGYLFWGLHPVKPRKDLYSFGRAKPVSSREMDEVLNQFRDKAGLPLQRVQEKFALAYILYGPEERKFFPKPPSHFPFARKVYEDSFPVVIYQINLTERQIESVHD